MGRLLSFNLEQFTDSDQHSPVLFLNPKIGNIEFRLIQLEIHKKVE